MGTVSSAVVVVLRSQFTSPYTREITREGQTKHGDYRVDSIQVRVMAYLPESLFRGSRQGLSLL